MSAAPRTKWRISSRLAGSPIEPLGLVLLPSRSPRETNSQGSPSWYQKALWLLKATQDQHGTRVRDQIKSVQWCWESKQMVSPVLYRLLKDLAKIRTCGCMARQKSVSSGLLLASSECHNWGGYRGQLVQSVAEFKRQARIPQRTVPSFLKCLAPTQVLGSPLYS